MGAPLHSSVVPFLALVALLATSSPTPATASSRHLHRHLESLDGPDEHDVLLSNTSRLLSPNVTANVLEDPECGQPPVNATEYQSEVGSVVSAFFQQLRNATRFAGISGGVTVVRLADGSLSIVNGNVTVSLTGQLVVNGKLTTLGVYNGTLSLNQTLPNITTLATSIFQRAANVTGINNNTTGSLLGGIQPGNGSSVPNLTISTDDLPSINFSPSMLINTTQILSYSPQTPDAILQYLRNLTAAALAAISEPNALAGTAPPAATGTLNLNGAPATPVALTGANQGLPGFPNIAVYFFVIVATLADRSVTIKMLVDQVAKINNDYGAAGFPSRFALAGIVRIANPQWVNRDPKTEENVLNEMKKQTRIGGPQDLNVWITTFIGSSNWNGFGTFPWFYKYEDTRRLDGVVISKFTLPMDADNPDFQPLRSVGITLTHEIGHWLGLFHTFQFGCDAPLGGDTIDDTQPEGTDSNGIDPSCTVMKYSCPAGNRAPPDPIFNFMDYGPCRRMFTAGQIVRVKEFWTAYRYNQG